MQVDVIGGSGFIGTRLVSRLLAAGHDVRIFDRKPSYSFPQLVMLGDIRSMDDLRNAIRPGATIVNLAAEHRDDVRPLSLYQEVNVEGARNLALVAAEKNVPRILFTSSVAVYGFAPVSTSESGAIAPFNDYGRTKYEAEMLLRDWHAAAPDFRSLFIIRPTVVFGERNRGNVYNLLRQIASGKFLMIGKGENRKSIAYVENVAAFLESGLQHGSSVSCYNYVDQPDFTMNELVGHVSRLMGRDGNIRVRLPFVLGLLGGKMFDMIAFLTRRNLPISSIRVRKFCANSVYATAVPTTGFVPPVPLAQALAQTVQYEFIETHENDILFYSE